MLHPRNLHQGKYNFTLLTKTSSDLAPHVNLNKYGEASINFADPSAVLALNKALLLEHYQLEYWAIPEGYLCPPIPGRADYIHHLADVIADGNQIPMGPAVKCLDIGIGANAIYSIVGCQAYGWSFVGSDIDEKALHSVEVIVNQNPGLRDRLSTRLQPATKHIFKNIIKPDDQFVLSVCNPPFHASQAEARAASLRKLNNLNDGADQEIRLNFGGQAHELWYPGGEERFIKTMVQESKWYARNCMWYSSLVSKEENVRMIKKACKKAGVVMTKVIQLQHGNKKTRVVAWTYLEEKERLDRLAQLNV